MNPYLLSPFVRIAKRLRLEDPSFVRNRILLDYELLLLEQGEFLLVYPEQTYHCRAPALIMIAPGIIHEFHSLGCAIEEPHIHFDMIYDQYSESFVGSRKPERLTAHEHTIMRPNIFKDNPLESPVLKVSDMEQVRSMFYDIIDTFQAKNFLYEIDSRQKMLLLLSYLFKESLPFCFEAANYMDTISYKIKNYIDDHFMESITLKELSEDFHYNPCYLTTMFQKSYNTTLMAYYRDKRLAMAKSMLLEGHSVNDVADKLHFSSIYAFSRFFKANAGCPPTIFIAYNEHNTKLTEEWQKKTNSKT